MASVASTKRKSTILGRARDNIEKRTYTKVTSTGPNTFKLVSSVFTGYANYWGDGSRANHAIVYVPSLRLSGTYADVRNYIVTAAGNPAAEQHFMRGTLTYENHNSSEPVEYLQFNLSAPLDDQSPFTLVRTTYADLFASEVAWSEGREAKADRSGAQLVPLQSLLTEINAYLGALDRPQVGLGSAKPRTSTSKTSGASSPSDIAKKLRERVAAILPGQSLNISGYKRGTGNGTRTVPHPVPEGGVRLSSVADGSKMDQVYFKLAKNGAGYEVPDGAYAFLEDMGYSGAQSRQIVDAARAAVPAVASKVALPVGRPSGAPMAAFGVPVRAASPPRAAVPAFGVPRSPRAASPSRVAPPVFRAPSPPRAAPPAWMPPSAAVPRSPRAPSFAPPAFGVSRSPVRSPVRSPRSSPSGLPLPFLGTP